jgi:hypothetical protein
MFFCGYIMPHIEGYNPFYPDVDTEFSADFNEDLFQQIKIGDDTASVIKKIGHPLEIYEINPEEYQWNYSIDGKCKWADFAWLIKAVIIDKEGKVIKKADTIAYD